MRRRIASPSWMSAFAPSISMSGLVTGSTGSGVVTFTVVGPQSSAYPPVNRMYALSRFLVSVSSLIRSLKSQVTSHGIVTGTAARVTLAHTSARATPPARMAGAKGSALNAGGEARRAGAAPGGGRHSFFHVAARGVAPAPLPPAASKPVAATLRANVPLGKSKLLLRWTRARRAAASVQRRRIDIYRRTQAQYQTATTFIHAFQAFAFTFMSPERASARASKYLPPARACRARGPPRRGR